MADVKIEGFDHIIREAVQKRIEASIADALDAERSSIVEKVVQVALSAKVKDGYKDVPFLEKLARDEIQAATREVVGQWVKEQAIPELRAELERQLATKKAQRELASALIGMLTKTAEKANWNVKVAFDVPELR